MVNKFKDQCDICKKFDYCKSYNNMILCSNCISKEKEKKTPVKIEGGKYEQKRFIFESR